MVEVDLVFDDQPVGRNDADALLPVRDLDRLRNPKDRNLGAEPAHSGGIDQVHERQCAAVDDGDFGSVDVNVDVGDAAAGNRGQKMFDRADRNVVFADGRRVIKSGGGALKSGNAKAMQVGADEGDATPGNGRPQLHPRVDARVETNPADADLRVDGLSLDEHFTRYGAGAVPRMAECDKTNLSHSHSAS